MSRVDPRDPAIQKALADVLNESSKTNWMLTTYVPRSSKLKLVDSGTGGWEEMIEDLSDGKVYFGFVRFTVKEIFRYVYFSWLGEGVQGMLAGQFNNHSQDMARFFRGFHVQINARSEEDLDEDAVLKKLTTALGAAYEAGDTKGRGMGKITVQQAQKNVTTSKSEIKRTDAGAIDQSASAEYWNKNSATESASSGYKKNTDFKQGSDAGGLKSKFESLAREQAPDAPQAVSRAPVKLVDEPAQRAPVAAAPPPSDSYGGDDGGYDDYGGYDEPAAGGYEEEAAGGYEEEAYEEEAGGYEEEGYAEEAGGYEEEGYAEEAAGGYEEEGYAEEGYEEEAYAEGGEEEYYEEAVETATAKFDYAAENESDLSFSAGDVINIWDRSDPGGWWQGELNGVDGYFPSNFVELN